MTADKSSRSYDFKALEEEYKSIAQIAGKFASEITNQIKNLLEDTDIVLGFPIQYRIKTIGSIVEKLNRTKISIKNVTDLQDLIGIRIITLFQKDALLVNNLITENFHILKQYNTQKRLKEDQFGYSSVHYIVKLQPSWLALPTLAQMGNLKAEIQVRSLAQHTWAEASHKFQYKNEGNVPVDIRRTIYRISALLEIIDLEFDRLIEERKAYRISADISGTDEVLNVDLLEKTLDSLFPHQNKGNEEAYSEILSELTKFEIITQQQLIEIVSRNIKKALQSDADRVDEERNNLDTIGDVVGTTIERINLGVFFTHVGLLREVMGFEFGSRYNNFLLTKSQ